METKIIKAVFGGSRYTVTAKRTRTDYGQVLEFVGVDLPDTFECIFSNSATSAGVGKKMIGSAQRVLIPDEYLKTGQPIYAWILLHDTEDDGRHMYNVKIPVADMPNLSPEEPTPVEQSVISQAITALNSAVETTAQKASEASASADRAEQAAEGAEGYAERAESAQHAAESARDIALEAKVSAQASAATATEKASEAISSATTASQSAITAENASESASASADASAQSALRASQFAVDASVRAHNASEYAQTASGYASNASASAQTASQKASEAAQSASTAVQAKTDAEAAKTASETAQGLAEQARNEAVSAKTGAESARDEAQDIVDGITVRAEQIVSNTERIESLEDDRYKPYPTDTVSGSIASFPDGADNIPLKSCIVRVEPVQEGSGDPSPDNIRPITGWTGCEVKHSGADTSNPTTYPITFPTEAGTVYGGTLDVTSGVLTVDRAMVEYDGSNDEKWGEYGADTDHYCCICFPVDKAAGYQKSICNEFKNVNNAFGSADYGTYSDHPNFINTYFRMPNADVNTKSEFLAWIAQNPIRLCYELASPITYTLTTTEIKTLLGQNNIWADCGDTEVEYRADVTKYIDRKITEAVSALT